MPERKKLLLRLDPEVYEAVARWASDDLRSVNSQIEYALRLALRANGRAPRKGPATGPAEGWSAYPTGGDPVDDGGPGQPDPDHGP